ncbi:MAG: hypothetical protein IK014_03815 [Lachnospiraceae bacterium]|nr:hypothetical protein [Lachnospiraceae bacterium]
MKRYFIIGFFLIIIIFNKSNTSVFAKNGISNIDTEDMIKLNQFIENSHISESLSFLLQEEVSNCDMDCSNAMKVNILPNNFTDIWTYDGDIKNIYGTIWQYKIPMIINDKYVVVTISINDKELEYVGASYGDDYSKFFIDENAVKDAINKENIKDEDIVYSDILFSNILNTLIIHYNVKNHRYSDYFIPFSIYDIKDISSIKEYRDSYEDGKIFNSTELIYILAYTDIMRGSNIDGNKNGGISVSTQYNNDGQQSITNSSYYNEDNRMFKYVLFGSFVTIIAILIIIFGKKYLK